MRTVSGGGVFAYPVFFHRGNRQIKINLSKDYKKHFFLGFDNALGSAGDKPEPEKQTYGGDEYNDEGIVPNSHTTAGVVLVPNKELEQEL